MFGKLFGPQPCSGCQSAVVGDAIALQGGDNMIYYLIIKKAYRDRPLLGTLRKSFELMRDDLLAEGIQRLSMRKIRAWRNWTLSV